MPYYSGQGKLYVAERDGSGNALSFRFLGNVPTLRVTVGSDTVDHKEAYSGNRIVDKRITRETKCELSFEVEEFNHKNLLLALWGATKAQTGAAVTNEAFPNPVAVGDFVRLKHPKVSAVAVKDNLSASLTVDTHYKLNANHGTVEIVNLAAFTQPLKADYTYATHDIAKVLGDVSKERWFRFEGLNTADTNQPVLVELYRTQLNPLRDFDLINDEIAKYPLDGVALYDATKSADDVLGTFGRVILIP
jgi:hypothetical protein